MVLRTALVQDVKTDLSRFNYKISNSKVEWYCVRCASNSLLPSEYGCSGCQPYNGNKLGLRGRVYYKEKE